MFSLVCVCVILVPFLASTPSCSLFATGQCPVIHCSAICLWFALICPIRAWQSPASVAITFSVDPTDIIAAF